jgi:hypothetical protein
MEVYTMKKALYYIGGSAAIMAIWAPVILVYAGVFDKWI